LIYADSGLPNAHFVNPLSPKYGSALICGSVSPWAPLPECQIGKEWGAHGGTPLQI